MARGRPRLPTEAQRLLGAKLRAQYANITNSLPLRFVPQIRRLRTERAAHSSGEEASAHAAATPADAFDPEAIKLLTEALDSACNTLQGIGNERFTREQVARRIIELAKTGERDPARLAARALTSLITGRRP